MSYVEFNPNPYGKNVGDCVIRALSGALQMGWNAAYVKLALKGMEMGDMPSSNSVWGTLLEDNGFKKMIPECQGCVTIREFAQSHPFDSYVLATGTHVVYLEKGNYIDTWDSGDEVIAYYFVKEKNNE